MKRDKDLPKSESSAKQSEPARKPDVKDEAQVELTVNELEERIAPVAYLQ